MIAAFRPAGLHEAFGRARDSSVTPMGMLPMLMDSCVRCTMLCVFGETKAPLLADAEGQAATQRPAGSQAAWDTGSSQYALQNVRT